MRITCPNCGHSIADVTTLDEDLVKTEQTVPPLRVELTDEKRKALALSLAPVKPSSEKLPSVAQDRGGDLTKEAKREVLNMYHNGYSLARIRQLLGVDVSITRLQTIVKKKR